MALVSKAFGDIITFTRASTATYFDSTGILQSAAIDAPRLDYDPSTLAAQGLLIEEARTNGIRNNTMQGAVAGTPGTAPTNWVVAANPDGLTREIVGDGIQNGINYVDIRWSGTSGTGGTVTISNFDTNNVIVAANGQTWTTSFYVALVGGSLTNISTLTLGTRFNDNTGAQVTTGTTSVLTLTSSLNRFTVSTTATDATTAYVNGALVANFVNSSAVDFTLRIGLPQLELGAFATSVIPTTTTALTRAADVASVNTLSPWYNAAEGTLYGEVSSAAITVSGVSRRIANINDGTEADRITVGWAGATSVAAAFVTDNSIAQAGFTSPSGAYPFPTKVALAYKAADFQAAVNGSAFTAVTSGTVPTVNRMTIGDVVTGSNGTQNINGHLRRITYYPRRLSNAELQTITA